MSAIPTVPAREAEAAADLAEPARVLVWPIDPNNPYTVSLHTAMGDGVRVEAYTPAKLAHRYALWHIHWPEALLNIRNPALAAFKLNVFLAMIDSVRARGGRIVWTLHNLKAHDALHPKLEARFYPRFLRRVDGVIGLSPTGLEMAQEKFPRLRDLPAAVIPHGDYRGVYPPYGGDARAALGIAPDARVILYFGEVRGYKNVEALVRAFRGIAARNALLYVAGRPKNEALAQSVRREAAEDPRVRLQLEFIDRGDVAKLFGAADLVVLPYRQILNSGAALLALSMDRPVLVPDLGAMRDLQQDMGPEWVRTYSGEIGPETLEDTLDWAARRARSQCRMPDEYTWENIRAKTVRFYREVMQHK